MQVWLTEFQGELAALSAALLWAIASVVYARLGKQVSPLVLNLTKGAIAIALLILTLLLQGNLLPDMSLQALGLLLLSGAVGIGLGDTFYFESLNLLGARRTLLIEALAPPLSALLALIFLQETLGFGNWVGILLTVAGVTWVVSERVPNQTGQPNHAMRGISYGLLATLGQASGAVLSRAALAQSNISPLSSTLVRLIAGLFVLLIWLMVRRQISSVAQTLTGREGKLNRSLLGAIALTAFFSTYLGIWLQQTSLKYAATGVAQALSSTSPLFILPLAIWLGETVSVRAVLGVLVALAGVWLLFSQ